MIELLIATNVASVAVLGIFAALYRKQMLEWKGVATYWRSYYDGGDGDYLALTQALQNLRRNCFLKNERGNRVRYINASPELRAKAEGN